MIKIGITGGIGSGKSIVSHLLHIAGVPVYISDIRSKYLTVHDPEIRRSLISLLGDNVYLNNELNKTLLANYLFENQENTQKINNIIHPRVKEDFKAWTLLHANYPIVGIESAILIEAGFKETIDQLIMVYAPLEIRIGRTMERDSASKEAVLQRIKRQMNDEEKREQADYIILNDGNAAIIPQLNSILEQLRSRDQDS